MNQQELNEILRKHKLWLERQIKELKKLGE